MKILCWNMGAAFGFRGAKHVAAWEWLNSHDAEVAVLQEAVDRDEFVGDWKSVIHIRKWQNWGCAVLVWTGGYQQWQPTGAQPWLEKLHGAVVVAEPLERIGPWFASVHSDSSSLEQIARKTPEAYGPLPSADDVLRCSGKEMWEIEPIAHELGGTFAGRRFVMGGDLNSSLMFDDDRKQDIARLFGTSVPKGSSTSARGTRLRRCRRSSSPTVGPSRSTTSTPTPLPSRPSPPGPSGSMWPLH